MTAQADVRKLLMMNLSTLTTLSFQLQYDLDLYQRNEENIAYNDKEYYNEPLTKGLLSLQHRSFARRSEFILSELEKLRDTAISLNAEDETLLNHINIAIDVERKQLSRC